MELVLCNSKSEATGKGCNFSWDIIEEILARLDAKSVTRFKCVSKSWLCLISSPSFMNRHHKQQVSRTLLVLNDPEPHYLAECYYVGFGPLFSFRNSENFEEISARNFPYASGLRHRDSMDLSVVGSQNGVLCLFDVLDQCVCLWNPAIKMVKKLPPFSPVLPKSSTNTVIDYVYGFGYEPITNDFKVVAVSARRLGGTRNLFRGGEQVGVFSLRRNSWTSMEMPDLLSRLVDSSNLITYPSRTCPAVLGSSIHWLLAFGTRPKLDSFGIVAFDLTTEEFKLIPPPLPVAIPNHVHSISILFGCLSMLTFHGPASGLIEIWVMEKYGAADSWAKHLSIDLVMHPVAMPSFQSNHFEPIGVADNGNLFLEADESPQSLCFYDPRSSRVQYLCPWTCVLEFTNYAESIFLS